MKPVFALLTALSVWGDAPICATDGYTVQCFYFSWAACEAAIVDTENQRCIANPESRE